MCCERCRGFFFKLGNPRNACLCFSATGAVVTVVRVSALLGDRIVHQANNNYGGPSEYYLFSSIAIAVGLISSIVELFLLLTLLQRATWGLGMWKIASVVCSIGVSFPLGVAAAIVLDTVNAITLSSLLDFIRVICEYYLVSRSVSVGIESRRSPERNENRVYFVLDNEVTAD